MNSNLNKTYESNIHNNNDAFESSVHDNHVKINPWYEKWRIYTRPFFSLEYFFRYLAICLILPDILLKGDLTILLTQYGILYFLITQTVWIWNSVIRMRKLSELNWYEFELEHKNEPKIVEFMKGILPKPFPLILEISSTLLLICLLLPYLSFANLYLIWSLNFVNNVIVSQIYRIRLSSFVNPDIKNIVVWNQSYRWYHNDLRVYLEGIVSMIHHDNHSFLVRIWRKIRFKIKRYFYLTRYVRKYSLKIYWKLWWYYNSKESVIENMIRKNDILGDNYAQLVKKYRVLKPNANIREWKTRKDLIRDDSQNEIIRFLNQKKSLKNLNIHDKNNEFIKLFSGMHDNLEAYEEVFGTLFKHGIRENNYLSTDQDHSIVNEEHLWKNMMPFDSRCYLPLGQNPDLDPEDLKNYRMICIWNCLLRDPGFLWNNLEYKSGFLRNSLEYRHLILHDLIPVVTLFLTLIFLVIP